MTANSRKISLIEDSEIHLEWFKCELLVDKTLNLVSADTTGREGLESVKAHKPELVLLDFQLKDLTGLEVARRIKAYDPGIKIFMLTAHTEQSILERLMHDKNVDAISIKGSPNIERDFLIAIHSVLQGNPHLDSSILTQLRESRVFPGIQELTSREFEVFIQISCGKKDTEIAKDLFIELSGVRNLKSRIAKKIKDDNIKRLIKSLLENANVEE